MVESNSEVTKPEIILQDTTCYHKTVVKGPFGGQGKQQDKNKYQRLDLGTCACKEKQNMSVLQTPSDYCCRLQKMDKDQVRIKEKTKSETKSGTN